MTAYAGALTASGTVLHCVRTWPIAGWRAWHAEGIDDEWVPGRLRTSQRAALQTATAKYNLCFGGNRTGKTEWLLALTVAYALGSDHPAIRLWGALNGVDLSEIPTGPGRVWLVAPDHSTSVKNHRGQIEKRIGRANCKGDLASGDRAGWWNKEADGEARLKVAVPRHSEPAEITFKAYKQGREAFQSSSLRAVFFDEEGPADIFDECEQRVGDQAGRLFFAMTPLKGLTWVHAKFVAELNPEARTNWLERWDNPHYPRDEKKRDKLRAEREPDWADARIRGLFVVMKGRIYTQFSRRLHVVEPYEIPLSWPRRRAIDFGTSPGNPHVCTWAAIKPDGQIVVYRQYRAECQTIKYHAERTRELEAAGERPSLTWCDPEDPGKILSLRNDHPIGGDIAKGSNAILVGIDAVQEALQPRADGTPGIVFLNTPDLATLFTEFDSYQWAETREKPKENQNDHGLDTVRYLVMGIRKQRSGIAVGAPRA